MSQTQSAPVPRKKQESKHGFLHEHSLSIASSLILLTWLVLYLFSNPSTHAGSFFGNAIADWSGVVVTVLATKYLYEKGLGRKPLSKAQLYLGARRRISARAFADHFSSDHRYRLGGFISADGSERKMGPSRREYRLRVDPDLWPRVAYEANDRAPLERK